MTRLGWISLVLLAATAHGATYYVDRNAVGASDSNPGTEESPWLTITKATTTVTAGDTVYIKGSTNPASADAIYDRSGANGLPIQTAGTAGNTITYAAYTGHTVILQGNGTGNGIALDYASYHAIKGLTFKNFNKATEGFETKTDILIEDCEFTQTYETGLRLRSITNLTVRDCYIHHCFEAGVMIRDGCVNVLMDNVQSNNNTDSDGTSSSDGFTVQYNCDNITFKECSAINNSGDGFDLNGTNVLVVNCIAHGQGHDNGQGYDESGGCNVKCWRRPSPESPAYRACDYTFINCVFYDCLQTGIKVNEGARVDIYNCTIDGSGEEGIAFRALSGNGDTTPVTSHIINAIISDSGYEGIGVDGAAVNVVDADHCLFYSNVEADNGLHANTNAITDEDPLFFGAESGMFQLTGSSPALEAGVGIEDSNSIMGDLGYECPSDFAGTCRPSGDDWDIGAYERVDNPGNTAPEFTDPPAGPPSYSSVNEGSDLSIQFSATDSQSDDCFFFLSSGVEDGMAINSSTGLFTWTPTYTQGGNTADPCEAYDVVVAVTDEYFAEPADTTTIRIVVNNVNRAPVYGGITGYTAVAGRVWKYGLHFTDIDGDTMVFTATGKPTGMTIGRGSGIVSWNPTAEQVGDHAVTVRAADPATGTNQAITFTVLPETPYTAPTDEANIFYVDGATGSDSDNGQTAGDAWATIQHAATTLTAGQMVLIRAGTYAEEATPNSGTAGSPIVFKAYPSEAPIMDGQSFSSPEAFQGGSHIVYDGLTFRNYGETLDLRESDSDIVVVNCTIEDATDYGIYGFAGDQLRVEHTLIEDIGDRGYYGSGGTNVHFYDVTVNTVTDRGLIDYAPDNLTVTDCNVTACGRFGIWFQGHSVQIQDSVIHDNAQIGVQLDSTYAFMSGSMVSGTTLYGGTAMNLFLGQSAGSHAWISDTTISDSERYGVYVGPNSIGYATNVTFSGNASDNVYIETGGSWGSPPAEPAETTKFFMFTK